MLDAINMLWTTVYNLLSGVNRLAKSFDDVASVVEINAKNFSAQEKLECEAKTRELANKLKEVA